MICKCLSLIQLGLRVSFPVLLLLLLLFLLLLVPLPMW